MNATLKRFLTILLVGILCSGIPFLHFGMIMGFPAVLINSIFLTILYDAYHRDGVKK